MTRDEIWTWANNTDEGTWFTHWAQGFGFFLLGSIRSFDLGAGLSAGAFAHREISGFMKAVRQHGMRGAIRTKLLDGIGDLLFAGLGAFTALALLVGGLWAFAGALAGSAAAWAMMATVARNKRKKGK